MKPAAPLHLKDYKVAGFLSVMVGTCILCLNGGYINGVCVTGIFQTGLTHMTGLTTNSAKVLINPPHEGQLPVIAIFGFIISFLLGSLVVGIIIGPARLTWGPLQGFCILIEGLAILLGWYFSPDPLGGMFISFSMGVQNGITSNFSALTIRTSHVSGTVLDIGMAIGQCLHLRNLDNFWKLKVHVPSYAFFWLGSLLGAMAFNVWGKNALGPSYVLSILIGIATLIYNIAATFYKLSFAQSASSNPLYSAPS
eukprot:TRINITY_DN17874_c0_g1_i1.p1 TRINITY_DN17874_c0_g1~~TRINITY_DN17874_c0_g1_i1.p1  ORF type:complete len:253 (-),score=24.72 TRINITY_DN17874_c0_g1_i1:119-877(-)